MMQNADAERALDELDINLHDALDAMLARLEPDDAIHAELNRITNERMSRLVTELIDTAMDRVHDRLVRSGLDEQQIAELTQLAYRDAETLLATMLAKVNAKWGHGQQVH